mgnify:CR=1 FL=1
MKRLLTLILLLGVWGLWATAQTGHLFGSDKLSSTNITSICQDQMGYIWIGTEFGLNRFDGYRFTSYLNDPRDSTSLCFNTVVSLLCDREGRLWVGTAKGIQRYDPATDRFVNYQFPDSLHPRASGIVQLRSGSLMVGTSGYGLYELDPAASLLKRRNDYQSDPGDVFFNAVFEDAGGGFWKGGANRFGYRPIGKGVQMFSTTYGVPTAFFDWEGRTMVVCRDRILAYEHGQPVDSPIDLGEAQQVGGFRTAVKDRAGNVYVGTRGNGLFWIPARTRRLLRYATTAPGFDMNTASIMALLEDRQGNIWVGCQQKGLFLIPNHKAQFTSWSFSGQKQDIGSCVSSVCEGDDGITWCTVENKGVYGFDRQGRIVAHPQSPNGVEFIYRDTEKAYFLGTTHGLYTYDPLTGRAQLFSDFVCDKFNTMTDDGRGHLFISVYAKGMLVYDRATRQFRFFTMTRTDDPERATLCNDWILSMITDRDGRVWIGTSDGVTCYDPQADTFRPFGWTSLLHKSVNTLMETRDGDISIGTEQGPYMWFRSTNQMMELPESEPLKNLSVCYVVQDNAGDYWCSTTMGIWHFRMDEQKWVSYISGSGLSGREYVACAGLHTADDRIFFATGDGLTTFTPQQVSSVQTQPGRLQLTGFYIDGRAVSTLTESNGTQVTEQPVGESNHFTVSYLDNTFTLEFSLLNYVGAANVVFEHRLNDGDWIAGNIGHNMITMNHLASGTYRLEVRAIDNGVVSESCFYTIVVKAPWYRSTLAYALYILGLLGLAGLLGWSYRRRMRQRLDEDKMKFLINATHDIRSPLTLILGPLEKLRRRQLDDESKQDLGVIDRNAQRILTLVNQILDVRKIDKQQMHLHCRETNMYDFVNTIYNIYAYNARERGINFTFTGAEDITAWVDRTQFDKVVSNLLSNAFKYSYDRGDISMVLSEGHDDTVRGPLSDYVELTVTDTGTGMRDDTLQHLFDRFYQGKSDKSAHIEGTGIGLNLCKMIVDMHHGSITGRNRTDGIKGSVFTVRLPLGRDHFSEAELDMTAEQPQSVRLSGRRQPSSSFHILVVDDDEEIAGYIANELSDYYYFSASHNGKDGLKELLTNSYDLVISDVMMPEMDGFTMLRLIRTNVNISHLPVIMLTSKTDIGNRLEGLEKGADAYLTKPFNVDELHATIDNLINTRLRLRGKFSGSQQPSEGVQQITVKGNDEQLMERIIKSINEHIGESEFGVDDICHDAGISRAHLHRKMKEMTGIPVSEFIRNIRMEQAARLLKEQKLNITQVAYTVGYSSLPYFSSVFRKHFGLSPREFIEKSQQES